MNIYQNSRFDLAFKKNNMLNRLIYANVAVFLGIKVLYLLFWLLQLRSPDLWVTNWLAVPSGISSLITRPWTVITYMFLHLDLLHIFSNMLWLFFLGQLFVEFLGEKKLWTVYIAGGLAGAALYILFFNLFPVFSDITPYAKALGASASVMAVVVAIGTYAPDFSIRLLFLGNIKLKYIAVFTVILDIISISDSNSGGHIAHLGGAALGFFFARKWKEGKDITAWVGAASAYLQALFNVAPKPKMKVKYRRTNSEYDYNARKKAEQEEVDAILDKISRSGYDSLSKKEKDILFNASNKN